MLSTLKMLSNTAIQANHEIAKLASNKYTQIEPFLLLTISVIPKERRLTNDI